jgi:carbon storage regulator CsrA
MGLGLSRKVGERIVVSIGGEQMVIEVTEIRNGNRVRLNFTAPESVTIHREEVAGRIAASGFEEEEPISAPC